jgi:hypothetical protein
MLTGRTNGIFTASIVYHRTAKIKHFLQMPFHKQAAAGISGVENM